MNFSEAFVAVYCYLLAIGDQERAHLMLVHAHRLARSFRCLAKAGRAATNAVQRFSGACRCMLEHMTDEEIAELRAE